MPAPLRFVSAAGHELAVLTGGDAADPRPPVLLVPGVVMPVGFWPPNLPSALRGGRRWASLSLPGHAPSRLPAGTRPEAIELATFAALVDDAARALWGDAAYVAGGYSTGGFAALCTAALRPERVAGVLSVSGFLDGRWGGLLGLMQVFARAGAPGRAAFRALSAVNRAHRSLFRAVFRSHARRALDPARFDATVEAVWPDVQAHDLDDQATIFAAVRRLDLRPEVGRIAAPTLIVHGERDLVPRREAEQAARATGGELVLLADTGHLFFAEAWEAFDRAASDWLDGIARFPHADGSTG